MVGRKDKKWGTRLQSTSSRGKQEGSHKNLYVAANIWLLTEAMQEQFGNGLKSTAAYVEKVLGL